MAWTVLLVACGQATGGAGAGGAGMGGMGGMSGSGGVAGASCADADHDGISDEREGKLEATPELSRDTDLDSTPDYLDLDSDGDGLPDAQEYGKAACLRPADRDEDFIPNFQDTDSDNDGLLDADEVVLGTNPTWVDSDGNGCWDIIDVTVGECVPKRDIVIQIFCWSDMSTGPITLNPAALAASNDVTWALHAEPPEALGSFVVTSSTAMIADGMPVQLVPGAGVVLDVQASAALVGAVLHVELMSASLGSLAHGRAFVLNAASFCTIPK
ncbi:MAG: hypothetical protein QM756_02955 [Polyangiaceae bacterium]